MSSSCCPPGSWEGPLNVEGPSEAKGTKITLGKDLTVYYTAPPPSSNIGPSRSAIIVFHDVWGLLPRVLSICDALAEKGGFPVVAPDCFRGKTKDDVDNMLEWFQEHSYEKEIANDIQLCMDFLMEKEGVSQFGAMGFCWGGWVIAKSAANGIPWSAGVSPHPSTGIEQKAFGNDEVEMMSKVPMPFLIMPAGNDPPNLKPGHPTVEELEKKGGKCVVFDKMTHGWTTRGDLSNPDIKKDTETALQLTLEFFKEHLSHK